MGIAREEQLQNFVAMYAQAAVGAVESYKKGNDPYMILADVTDEEKPIQADMRLNLVREEEFRSFNPDLITVRMALHQFRSCDKRQQCVLGLRFPDGHLYTHVLQIAHKKKSPN